MGRDHTSDTMVAGNLTPEQTHRARLFVCGQAVDADDAHTLLDMLGLSGRSVRSSGRQQARRRFTCSKGHPRTPDNVNKSNQCRECARENNRNYYARSKART